MLKIKDIHIKNFHSLEDVKFEFGPNETIFYGPNGSGKSTILQAIQWGLLGHIPGTNKTSSAIMSHSNSNSMFVEIRLFDTNDFDNYIIIRRSLTKIGNKFEEDFVTFPDNLSIDNLLGDVSFIIFNFNDFIALTANKQKDVLMSMLPSNSTSIDTAHFLKNLPEYSQESEDKIASVISHNETLRDVLDVKKLNADLKQLKTELDGEEKRAKATVQSLMFYEDYDGESDIVSLQDKITELTKQRDSALILESDYASREKQLKMLSEYSHLAETIELDDRFIEYNDELAELADKVESNKSRKLELEKLLSEYRYDHNQNVKVINSRGICPFIETDCDTIQDKIKEIELEDSKLVDIINSTVNDINTIDQILLELNKEIDSISKKLNVIRNEYDMRTKLQSVIPDAVTLPDITSSELGEQLRVLSENLTKASANKKYNEVMDILQKQKLSLAATITFIKSAIKATGENGLQTDIMKIPFSKLQKQMQEYLDIFGIGELGHPEFILESKANSFDFGFNRNKFISFNLLSSGEKCIFTLIMLLSILDMSESPMSFILIDDLFDHLDYNRYKTVIDNIKTAATRHQIIVAGVEPSNIDTSDVYITHLGDYND